MRTLGGQKRRGRFRTDKKGLQECIYYKEWIGGHEKGWVHLE